MSVIDRAKEILHEGGLTALVTVAVGGVLTALARTWRRAMTNEILIKEMRAAWQHEIEARDAQRRDDLRAAASLRDEDRERLQRIEGMMLEILQRR